MNLKEYQNYHEQKIHTNIEFPYNTYICSIPLDFPEVPMHWHSEMELIVVKKGMGKISVNYDTYTVTAGTILFIPSGQIHSIHSIPNAIMEYENILFTADFLLSHHEDICSTQFIRPLFQNSIAFDNLLLTPSLPYYEEIATLLKKVDTLSDARPEGYQLAIKGYFYQIFFILFSHKKRDLSVLQTPKSLEKMKLLIKYTEEHYSEPITIKQMAELLHYSPSHFMKFFKNTMGTSFISYLNDYRLTIVARNLRLSSDSILDIASQSGFDNLSYFNRLFKRKYKMTPNQFRKQDGLSTV